MVYTKGRMGNMKHEFLQQWEAPGAREFINHIVCNDNYRLNTM